MLSYHLHGYISSVMTFGNVTGAGLAASGNSVSSQGLIRQSNGQPDHMDDYSILTIFEIGFMIFMYLRKILICDLILAIDPLICTKFFQSISVNSRLYFFLKCLHMPSMCKAWPLQTSWQLW